MINQKMENLPMNNKLPYNIISELNNSISIIKSAINKIETHITDENTNKRELEKIKEQIENLCNIINQLNVRKTDNPPPEQDISKKKKSVLVIDDKPANIEVARLILEGENLEIIGVSNGNDGMKKAEECCPDLILLDETLPDINGLSICKKLKEHPTTKHIPIIFVSGETSYTVKVEAFKSGADDYINRPFNPDEYAVRIMRILKEK
jgi:PleD family two-component response regulator